MICRYNDRRNKNCIVQYYLNNTQRNILFCKHTFIIKIKNKFGLDEFFYVSQCINKVKLLFSFLTTKKDIN